MLSENKFTNGTRCHLSTFTHARCTSRGMLRGKSLSRGILCAAAACMLTGCIDNSYDVSDVDVTIGLQADGLKVKLGNTEKIYLHDIIDTDGNTKIDADNVFYLTEQGSTEIDYNVRKVTSNIQKLVTVNTTFRVLSWGDDLLAQLGLPQGTSEIDVPANLSLHGHAEGEDKADFTTGDIGKEIVRITRVYPKDFSASLVVSQKTSKNVDFGLDRLENFSVTLPRYVHLREVPKGWTLDGSTLTRQGAITFTTASQEICAVKIDYIDLQGHGTPRDGKITLDKSMTRVAMSGTACFSSKSKFTMREGDYADIELDIKFPGDGNIVVDSIRGIFDPSISPNVDPINISSELPDFLKDESTRIKVSNPTLKFNVDMGSLPTSVNVSATLTSVKDGRQGWQQSVGLPQVTVKGGRTNTIYYHGNSSKPYDPQDKVGTDAIIQRVDNLGSLIERLPDRIEVDMKGGKVALAQQEATVTTGRAYRAKARYSVYVPLEVEDGFTILYKDSTESLGDDLEDYTAEGLELSAVAESTIPLGLELTIEARDRNNRPMPGIVFTKGEAKAGQGEGKAPEKSEMTMKASLGDPKDLQRVDHFVFAVKAVSAKGSQAQPLSSKQYIRLADIRLRLKGKVTADLN